MDKNSRIIIIFLRYPVPGLVKTRLASSVGDTKAALLYKQMAEKVVQTARNLADASVLYFIDHKKYIEECYTWLGTKENLYVQVKGDLGKRLNGAFEVAFKRGARQVLIIGTDIPSITGSILMNAFKLLTTLDSVLGKTVDGGYYLIGLKSPADFLFTNIPWSTNSVSSETIHRLKKRGMTYGLLPVLRDIDTLEDLNCEGFGNYSRIK